MKICYKGRIAWSKSEFDGQSRIRIDTSIAFKEFDLKAKTSFNNGHKIMIE